jgi:hypothetical protein
MRLLLTALAVATGFVSGRAFGRWRDAMRRSTRPDWRHIFRNGEHEDQL